VTDAAGDSGYTIARIPVTGHKRHSVGSHHALTAA
jgi:hypothetical protein